MDIAVPGGHLDPLRGLIIQADPGHAELSELDHDLADPVEQGLPTRRPNDGLIDLAEGLVEPGHPQDLLLLGAALGDIPHEADHPIFTIERQRPGADLHGESAAILPLMDRLEADGSKPLHLLELFMPLGPGLGGAQFQDTLSQQLCEVVPVAFHGLRVGFQDVAFSIQQEDDVVGFAHEPFEALGEA